MHWARYHRLVAVVVLVLLLEVLVSSHSHPVVAVVHLVFDVILVVRVLLVVLVLVIRSVPPLVVRPPTSVHEEVSHGGGLQPELSGNSHLHLLRGSLGLLENVRLRRVSRSSQHKKLCGECQQKRFFFNCFQLYGYNIQ